MKLLDILDSAPQDDKVILESFVMTGAKLKEYDKILCSISGGKIPPLKIYFLSVEGNLTEKEYFEFISQEISVPAAGCAG